MKLCEVLRQYRWATKREGKAIAAEIGIDPSVLSRMEHGKLPDGKNIAKILRWLLEED